MSGVALAIEKAVSGLKLPLVVSVMGCGVNGPGEAKEADIGVVGGKDGCLLYRKGQIVGKIKQEEIVSRVMDEVTRT